MAPKIDPEVGCTIPEPGEWPVDPQDDVEARDDRLWIDGCFDFFHHGHAGVMLQARRLGDSLLVGIHSDEEILKHKGPTVMNLEERVAAVNACRFSTLCVPSSPYVTSLPWIDHYGCKYVVHGDDITSDANGEDAYRFVKKAGRMKIVKRTPYISTTDLVGRMLLVTKDHHIKSLTDYLSGREGIGSDDERGERGKAAQQRIREYASAPNGIDPYVAVWKFKPKHRPIERRRSSAAGLLKGVNGLNLHDLGKGSYTSIVNGMGPKAGQRIVYVDGSFDLFSSGQITFLKTVYDLEDKLGQDRDWYSPSATQQRITDTGSDYPPAYIIAGLHDDDIVNHYKGLNYPIMNILERGLCVVQCKYIHSVIFSAPFTPSISFLSSLPALNTSDTTAGVQHPDAVYHGPTSFLPSPTDVYADAKAINIFHQTPSHQFADVNAEHIVKRIWAKRTEFEERQKRKGVKSVAEAEAARQEAEALRLERRDTLERLEAPRKKQEEIKRKKLERSWSEIEKQFGA
nr:hypothetical protein B0A51_11628 [Rachicladosporium sp. CCFEE 5018]